MKLSKKILSLITVILIFSLFVPQVPNNPTEVYAATIKLNKKNVTLAEGKTVKLKVSGTKQKISWKSSNKKVATVSNNGKVTAKKTGSAIITAKIGKKKLKCKITVKNAKSNTNIISTDQNTSNSNMVWIDDTGKKYHSKPTCSNMDAPYQVTLEKAISMGRDACKKCYK